MVRKLLWSGAFVGWLDAWQPGTTGSYSRKLSFLVHCLVATLLARPILLPPMQPRPKAAPRAAALAGVRAFDVGAARPWRARPSVSLARSMNTAACALAPAFSAAALVARPTTLPRAPARPANSSPPSEHLSMNYRTTIPFHVARRLSALCSLLLAGLSTQAATMSAGASVCYSSDGLPSTCYTDSHAGAYDVGAEVNSPSPTRSGYASAIVDWGVFHGEASAWMSDSNLQLDQGVGINAIASGRTSDVWTVSGPTGQGTLKLTWTVTGSTATSGNGPGFSSQAWLNIDVQTRALPTGGSGINGFATTGSLYVAQTVEMQGTIPVFFGMPLIVTTTSSVYAYTGTDSSFAATSFAGSALASFGHTAVLTGVEAYDLAGHRLDGITISAESGAHYPLSPVPEPASALLMGLGATALFVKRRRPAGR